MRKTRKEGSEKERGKKKVQRREKEDRRKKKEKRGGKKKRRKKKNYPALQVPPASSFLGFVPFFCLPKQRLADAIL